MSLNLSELRTEHARLENQNSLYDNFVKMPEGEGTIIVRLLPPKPGGRLYVVTRTHKINNKTLHSPMQLINGRWEGVCPINTHYRNLWKETERPGLTNDQIEGLKAEARNIRPLERYYYNCLIRSFHNPKTGETSKNVGPKILSVGKELHAKIIRAILGDPNLDEPELGDVTDTVSGRDLKIIKRLKKSGAMSFPNYDESKFTGPSLLGSDEEITKWVAGLHDLEALRKVQPIEELVRELNIHRGIEKDPSTTFEPSLIKTNHPVVESKPKVETVVVDDDEAMADDDFIRQLRGM